MSRSNDMAQKIDKLIKWYSVVNGFLPDDVAQDVEVIKLEYKLAGKPHKLQYTILNRKLRDKYKKAIDRKRSANRQKTEYTLRILDSLNRRRNMINHTLISELQFEMSVT